MSTPLWNKKVVCPFCDLEFETTRLRSSAIKVKERHSDFGSVYDGHCAYFYSITACPNCTLAARNENFEKLRPNYEKKMMAASKKLRHSTHKPHLFELGEIDALVAVQRHELALAFDAMREHGEAGERAGLTMHIAWIWRLVGEKAKEIEALRKAAKAYEEWYEKGSRLPEKLGEPGILFLIGECYRRCGEYQTARVFLGRALTSKELGAFPNIEHVLRDTMLSIKDEMQGN
jgi:uncharacterized protein (DUF2225 family)